MTKGKCIGIFSIYRRRKIMKRIKQKLKQLYKIYQNYGFHHALIEGFSAIFGQQNRIGQYFFYQKHEMAKKYLREKYKSIINKYREEEYVASSVDFTKIWFFWWQGEDNMPEVVKLCYQSVLKYCNDSDVVLITKDNLTNYVSIPEIILAKVGNGKFSIAAFSDYIRLSLLSKYGGVWLDSTILLTAPLKKEHDNLDFFSISYGEPSMSYHICMGKWMVSVLGVGSNTAIRFCQELFEDYFLKEDCHLTYLLIDCVIALAYELFPNFKLAVDSVKVENTNVGELDSKLQSSSTIDFPELLENQGIHKLSYKAIYNQTNFRYLTRMIENTNE